MQRKLTKKLSDTLRRDYDVEEHPPTRRQLPPQPSAQGTSRPGLPVQGQQNDQQYSSPPRSALLAQGQQQGQQYSLQSRRSSVPPSTYFEEPEVPEANNRTRSRNAAFLPSADQSLQSVTPRGKSSAAGPSKSSESTRQGRSGSGGPPAPASSWRSEELEGEESSNDLLSTVSDDFSYDFEVDARASEDFAENPSIVNSEVLVDDEAYESDYEATAVPQSRNSARKPRKSSQSISDRNTKDKKGSKKSSKSPVSRKQSKSKSITFSREQDTKVKRGSSRDKYNTRSSDPENNGSNNSRSSSSSNRRALDYSGRVPSLSGSQNGGRGGGSGLAGSSMSREVMALPIEIPESVTDADAFRRYLSVRRGATIGLGHPTTPFIPFEDHRTESCMDPIGGSGVRPGRTATNLNAQLTQGMVVHRRTVALSHAIMTLALLSASASQLRFVVAYANAHSYPALNYFLIISCIVIEIFVGIGYVVISRVDFSDVTLEKLHSYLIFGLFFVAISNVILAAFALDDHVCEVLAKRTEQYDNIESSPPLSQSLTQQQTMSQNSPPASAVL